MSATNIFGRMILTLPPISVYSAFVNSAAHTSLLVSISNFVVKSIKSPVQTNEIFYDGTACLILSSATSVVLYDIQQQKTIAEINSPPVKYVVWSNDSSLVALMSKHSECLVFFFFCLELEI